MMSACVLFLHAQQATDAERDHVRVTLNDGSVVDGYVQTYWTQGKLFKKMNTSFTMSPKPDGKDAVSYDAEAVKAIDFVVKTSADGRYDHLTVRQCSSVRPAYLQYMVFALRATA